MASTHYLAMIIISFGSFIFGILPITFTFRVNRHCPLLVSLILCLGAGVLLSTSLVHMLTEIQMKDKLNVQLYFCGGFFILYALDEICHFIVENRKSGSHVSSSIPSVKRHSYGTLHNHDNSLHLENNENSLLITTSSSSQVAHQDHVYKETEYQGRPIKASSSQETSELYVHSDVMPENLNQCHVEIGEPCSNNAVSKAGLLMALTIHSVLEGIAIGIQTEFNEILLLLGSITLHKVVLSFCMGLELHLYGLKNLYLILAVLLFSAGSSIGIFIGTYITSPINNIFDGDSQMQAIAAGSLLYVATFEVLPRERFQWQHKVNQHATGLFQLLFVLFGFIFISIIDIYLIFPHHNHGENKNSTDYVVTKSYEQMHQININ